MKNLAAVSESKSKSNAAAHMQPHITHRAHATHLPPSLPFLQQIIDKKYRDKSIYTEDWVNSFT